MIVFEYVEIFNDMFFLKQFMMTENDNICNTHDTQRYCQPRANTYDSFECVQISYIFPEEIYEDSCHSNHTPIIGSHALFLSF